MQNIHRDGKWCEKNTAKKKKKNMQFDRSNEI